MKYIPKQIDVVPKLAWRFVPMAICIICGYAVGTIAILAWLSYISDPYGSATGPWETYASGLLFSRYKFEGFDVPYADTVHYSIVATILFVLLMAGVVCGFSRFAPLWFVPAALRRACGLDRERRKRIWKRALATAPNPRLGRLVVIFLVSVAGTWLGLAADSLIMEIRQQLWMRNPALNPAFDPTPVPVVGWLTWADLVWIAALLICVDSLLVIRAARGRVERSRFFRMRWCRRCGYPLAETKRAVPKGSPRDGPQPVCPECGCEPLP